MPAGPACICTTDSLVRAAKLYSLQHATCSKSEWVCTPWHLIVVADQAALKLSYLHEARAL